MSEECFGFAVRSCRRRARDASDGRRKNAFLARRAAFTDYKYSKPLQVQRASPAVVTAMLTDCYSFFLHSSANPFDGSGERNQPRLKAPKSGMFLEGGGQNSQVHLGLNVVQGGQELV